MTALARHSRREIKDALAGRRTTRSWAHPGGVELTDQTLTQMTLAAVSEIDRAGEGSLIAAGLSADGQIRCSTPEHPNPNPAGNARQHQTFDAEARKLAGPFGLAIVVSASPALPQTDTYHAQVWPTGQRYILMQAIVTPARGIVTASSINLGNYRL